jgi:stress-induced morphogen
VFASQNRLKRHRTVNTALKDEIARIHAWSARCLTEDEWAKETEGAAAK